MNTSFRPLTAEAAADASKRDADPATAGHRRLVREFGGRHRAAGGDCSRGRVCH